MTSLLGPYRQLVNEQVARLAEADFLTRFWAHDASLWTDDPATAEFIRGFMGWTDIVAPSLAQAPDLLAFAREVWDEGTTDVVVCGMGGSSLCSLVLAQSFGEASRVRVHVLDSTDPGTVLGLRAKLDLAKTLFIVASKSGTTVEPKAFEDYFWQESQSALGSRAGDRFVAITDPGSQMEQESSARGYRRVFLGVPEIGGRYSVLSVFGLVTAALMGIDVVAMLKTAETLGPDSGLATADHEGVVLGATLGALGVQGRDKITFFTSDRLSAFGLWAEQLIAESTGKQGKGVLPLAQEPYGAADSYSSDRVFVVLADDTPSAVEAEKMGQSLAATGAPVLFRTVADTTALGREFIAWEVATAVIGSVLRLNPFDQPNVQEAKDMAKRKLAEVQVNGAVGFGTADCTKGDVRAFGSPGSFDSLLRRFLSQHKPGDQVALLAFLTESDATTAALQGLRLSVRDGLKVATSMGYGPRYLHSTGQFHKGGPNNGLFIVLTGGDTSDTPVPGLGVGFKDLKNAQAAGDVEALRAKGRRVLHVDLGPDVLAGLKVLAETL